MPYQQFWFLNAAKHPHAVQHGFSVTRSDKPFAVGIKLLEEVVEVEVVHIRQALLGAFNCTVQFDLLFQSAKEVMLAIVP
jgi:hypothetical protein